MKNIDNPSEKIIIALDGMDKDDVINLLKKIPLKDPLTKTQMQLNSCQHCHVQFLELSDTSI